MIRRFLRLIVNSGVVFSLLLLSPAQAGTMKNFLGKTVEKPKYGGTLNVLWPAVLKQNYWDEAKGHSIYAPGLSQTNETLFIGDWRKSAMGTGESSYAFYIYHHDSQTGHIAESWSLPDANTMVFKIRKGIHFHDRPPVNGRELDANDVVFSLKRLWLSKKCAHYHSYAWKKNMQELNGGPHIAAPDKWTVEIKTLPGRQGLVFEWVAGHSYIIPHEIIDKEGGYLEEWQKVNGTGPFMIKDYVEQNSITWERNPNYWMKDPVHGNMPLPYVDAVKFLLVPDQATRLAALRTGKADLSQGWQGRFSWDDAKSLKETNPRIQMAEFPAANPLAIYGRIDKKPFNDVRVRRALSMAIDSKSIVDALYGGHGNSFGFPVLPIPEQKNMYRPLSEFPEDVQETLSYNPEKAKKLLAEAGYPRGFKTEIAATSAFLEPLQVVQAYLSQIGVDLKIDVKERGAYRSMLKGKKHKAMIAGNWHPTSYFKFSRLRSGMTWNYAMVDDPKISEAEKAMSADYWKIAERETYFRNMAPYLLRQTYGIEVGTSNDFAFWQPWVKGYHGESVVGYSNLVGGYTRYVWLDK